MKVVWLCHFANEQMKNYFHKPNVKELAPWINNLIVLFENRTDIELHIVAPNIFTNKQKDIKIKNIHYHFYQRTPTFIPAKLNRLHIEIKTNFYFVKRNIARIINGINPDLIHLHGAENPHYSAGILSLLHKYPVLVTIQGLIRNSSEHNFVTNNKIEIESEILKSAIHIGVRTKEMSKTVLELNPKAHLYFHNYPLTIPVFIKENSIDSEFDIVFFARVCKDKGVEDLLEAVALVKKIRSNVSLQVIGSSDKSYLKILKNKLKQLDIENNVKFLGFIEPQFVLHNKVSRAKICVLPTYHDILPGTILESMFIKLPVIAYAAEGLSELNEKGQILVLVEKNNIQQLSNEIATLLDNESKRIAIAESAYNYVRERFNNNYVVDQIMKAYNEILFE
jgi:glycosyltransferase involved in cell wall biosynthesis